jgi:HJR/Mrr/RecB family endonuclease
MNIRELRGVSAIVLVQDFANVENVVQNIEHELFLGVVQEPINVLVNILVHILANAENVNVVLVHKHVEHIDVVLILGDSVISSKIHNTRNQGNRKEVNRPRNSNCSKVFVQGIRRNTFRKDIGRVVRASDLRNRQNTLLD